MKIKNTKRTYKKPIIAAAVLILVIAAYLAVAHHFLFFPFQNKVTPNTDEVNKVDYDKPTATQKEAGTSAKEEFEKRQTEATQQREETTNTPSSAPSTSKTVETVITSVNRSGNTLSVRTMMTNLDANGKCTLKLSKAGTAPVTLTAGTQTMGSYTICSGFDVPNIDGGHWTIVVSYEGSGGQTGSATKEVDL